MLFGSRARGDATPVSDIDIAIIDPSWTRRDIDEVHARLEEDVRTALKIDLLALHLVGSEDLRTRVLREGIVIHE
jgi:predicted nucleotidyltransferase